MAKGFKQGGGSLPLNFKVIGNPKPETAKENTIWVDTDEKITGWIFSATEPTEPFEGLVWIITDAKSSTVGFNALKKNGIQIVLFSAKQYIGGSFVDKAAQIYQGSEWVEWITYIYNQGDECVDISGGWSSSGYKVSDSGKTVVSGTKAAEYMELSGHATEQRTLGTQAPINADNIRTLYIDSQVTKTNGYVSIICRVEQNAKNGTIVASYDFGSSLNRKVVTIDLSEVSGNIYIRFITHYSTSCAGRIYGVWWS